MVNTRKRRANSIKQVIDNIETDPQHHLTGPFLHSATPSDTDPSPVENRAQARRNGKARYRDVAPPSSGLSRGLWGDITSMNWARVPSSALFLMAIPVLLYFQWELLSPGVDNPFKYLLAIQYELPPDSLGAKWHRKGYGDIAFLCYYIIVFCFIRQSLTIHVFAPLARKLGINRESKVDRFCEQLYAITYFGTSGSLGLMAMKSMPTWYFEGRHFFQDYPYWRMTPFMKWYYLLQFSYWLQQFIVLVLGLEKPRKDFRELVIHHIVTLWLIGWSYLINFTPIGNAVFITMDISDVFLAISKTSHYLKFETLTTVAIVCFTVVWIYLRHYLNIYILYSVWKYFDLIPKQHQVWAPETGAWLVPWMKWQIFIPLVLLHFVNLFWLFLILRIVYRAVFKSERNDDRSDDEDDGEPDEPDNDKDD